MSQNPSLSAEALLQHEPFVRAVVRGLLSDEDRIQDVLQETWLTALRRPPRAGSSLRAWLARVAGNLARDAHRRASRRSARERAVARPEAVESVAAVHERLATQREVVDVVLALREPYRDVVLLRYYQDLDTAAIAQRLGRSPATVRSQLSRAHELLRSGLDARFGGERSAWASVLVPLASRARLAAAAGKGPATTAAKATVGALVAGALVVVLVPSLLEPTEPTLPAAIRPAAPPGSFAVSPAALATAPEPGAGRQPVEARSRAVLGPAQRARLESRSMRELLELAVQIQRAIEAILLTPDERVVAEQAALLASPRTGLCRILVGNGTESRYDDAITKRGGGAYYSFATRDHSYDAEPDLSFHHGKLGTSFYGNQLGLLLELGDVPLADLPERGQPPPPWLTEEEREAWEVLWGEISLEDAAHGSAFEESTRGLRRPIAPREPGSTFLLRSFSPREHDQLVAFRPLVLDDTGCTLAWRILATWPAPGGWEGPADLRSEHPEVPPGPSWLAEMPLEDLLELLALVRAQAREALLEVPQALKERYAEVVGRPAESFADQAGFGRILHRGKWDPLVEVRGGGAYFSFLTRSNAYDEKAELELEGERYSSGFAGHDKGLLLDLGEIPSEQLGSVMSGDAPVELSPRQREAWDFLWSVRATVQDSPDAGRRALGEEQRRRAAELGLLAPVPALVGHTYLLRSVLFSAHDHLVVFTVLGGDEYGHSLAWRILRSWPVEQPSRAR